MGLNKKTVAILLISFLVLGAFPFSVNAEWTSPDAGYLIENIGSQNDQSAFTSAAQKIFYCIDNSRWYVLYPVDVETDDFCGYYSYSDADDPTTWNNGGMIGMQMRSTATIGTAIGSQLSWTYDNDNGIGHIVTFWDTTGGTNRGLYYANFTVEPDGSLDFSSRTKIVVMGVGCYGSVDIALSHDNHPIIGFGGLYDSVHHHWAMICDSFNGHTGTWTAVQYQPPWTYTDVAIIPTGNNTCLLVSGNVNTHQPLKYYNIEFGVTSNSSGSGTSFTDQTVRQDSSQVSYGVSYNSTHGCVHYTDHTSMDTYSFIFDFETITKTDEYLTDSGGYEGYVRFYAGATINTNEFFVTNKLYRMAVGDKHIWGNEYHNPSYDSFFNASAIDFILESYTQTYNNAHLDCMNTARMSDEDTGISIIVYEQENSVYATYWNITGEYPTPEPFSFVVSADLEDVDDDGADWVFTDWKYYEFTVTANLTQIDNASIAFIVPTGEENIWCGFWSDSDNWAYSSNMSYESREGEPCKLKAGSWNETAGDLTFDIWFESRILDVWNPSGGVDVYGSYNASEWELAESNLFRIYSKGGFEMNFASTGTAGKLAGGTPFSLYANNGSIVYNEIWYRDGQHIKLMPDIHFFTGLEPFYIRYGVDYSVGDGEWLEGWSIYINPKFVSYTGIFAANVWINMTNIWNNRGSYVDDKDLYMFYHGSVTGEGDPGHWKSWVDLWFSDKNASKVGAGRYNAYEFPMIDSADLWLRWLANNWGVKDNVLKEMSMQIPLLDTDNSTVISSEQIKMMRFWCELEVDDTDSGQFVSIENYEAFDITRSKDLPLVGMSDPVFDETLLPTVGQRGILGALFTLFAGFGQWMSENVIFGGLNLWSTFVNFLDTISGMFGYPTFFSDLFSWIAVLIGYMADSAGYIGTIATSIFSLFGALLGAFLTTMAEIISTAVNTITMFTDMMAGGYGVGVDMWETFGIGQWITIAIIFYPLYLVILWEEKGMDAVIQQLTWMFGLLSWLFDFFVSLIQFTIRLITTVIESIPVAEALLPFIPLAYMLATNGTSILMPMEVVV